MCSYAPARPPGCLLPPTQVKNLKDMAAGKGAESLKAGAEALKEAASKAPEKAADVKTFFGHVKDGFLEDWRKVGGKLKE